MSGSLAHRFRLIKFIFVASLTVWGRKNYQITDIFRERIGVWEKKSFTFSFYLRFWNFTYPLSKWAMFLKTIKKKRKNRDFETYYHLIQFYFWEEYYESAKQVCWLFYWNIIRKLKLYKTFNEKWIENFPEKNKNKRLYFLFFH